MANATVSRLGQINGAGTVTDLFLKQFGGEVLTAFLGKTEFMKRHMLRSISSGKSAQFPATGLGSYEYHTPGAEIVGAVTNHAERVITIDDLAISHSFISNIDEAMNHYDVRSIYSTNIGYALAKVFDQNVSRVGVLAARASTTVTGGNGGTVITSSTSKTVAADLVSAIFDAAQALDEKDVPENDRFCFLKPAQYSLLAESGLNVLSRDYGNDGNGSQASGKILRIAGIELVKTNNLASANDSALSTIPAAYRANFSTTSALVMQKSAVGTVKLIDLAVESAYDIRRQGTLMVGKMAIGHGILRPECAVEIKTS